MRPIEMKILNRMGQGFEVHRGGETFRLVPPTVRETLSVVIAKLLRLSLVIEIHLNH
jgi:hypothetical protein